MYWVHNFLHFFRGILFFSYRRSKQSNPKYIKQLKKKPMQTVWRCSEHFAEFQSVVNRQIVVEVVLQGRRATRLLYGP
jgi:hypothetical protein